MGNELDIHVRIAADAARYAQGLLGAGHDTRKFGDSTRAEFARIRASVGDLRGQLAALGLSFAAMKTIADSARMDKGLTQIGQTAGASRQNVLALRNDLFRMAKDTGQPVEDLQAGFNNAVQAGLNFKEALPVLDATNKAMAVTGANARVLTSGLTVAGTAFQFDLAKPNMAIGLLDKMTVAGRLGNAELENLSDIFARLGVNSASAGFGFDQTLGFIEALSQIERQPERLATLADSTLRVFTNLNYMKAASKATHVRFFNDEDGSRRDPVAVMRDLKKEYDKLKTDKDRAIFVQKAFGKADLDTIKGMKAMFSGDMLDKVGEFSTKISQAAGTLERDLPGAINNAIDATGRLKATLREAADGFTKPIRDTFTDLAGFAMAKKEDGGLGLDGKDMLGGGAAIGAAALVGGMAWRIAQGRKVVPLPGIPAVASEAMSLGKNVAIGKTLQTAAGVQPVYVVNMPDNLAGGANPAGPMPSIPGAKPPVPVPPVAPAVGAGRILLAAGAAAATAGALMYVANKGGEAEAKRLGIDPAKRREYIENKQQSAAQSDQATGAEAIIAKAVASGRMTPAAAEKARAVNAKLYGAPTSTVPLPPVPGVTPPVRTGLVRGPLPPITSPVQPIQVAGLPPVPNITQQVRPVRVGDLPPVPGITQPVRPTRGGDASPLDRMGIKPFAAPQTATERVQALISGEQIGTDIAAKIRTADLSGKLDITVRTADGTVATVIPTPGRNLNMNVGKYMAGG